MCNSIECPYEGEACMSVALYCLSLPLHPLFVLKETEIEKLECYTFRCDVFIGGSYVFFSLSLQYPQVDGVWNI